MHVGRHLGIGTTQRSGLLRRVIAVLAALVVGAAGSVAVTAAPGYADAAGKGGDFVPLSTAQLLDTRSGVGASAGVRGPGSVTTVQVLGRAGVPAGGVSAVLIDVTAVNPTVTTHLTVWPDGTPQPGVSMLSVKPGVVQSNSAVVPVGANGKISYYNNSGSMHIVSEVHGYFLAAATTGSGRGGFVPVTHIRLADTRTGLGVPQGTIPAGGSVTVTVGNGTPIPATAGAAFLNLTVVGATRASYLSAYPAGGSPVGSTFDYPAGTTAQTMAVKLGTGGRIVVRNNGGAPINLTLDAHGYFAATPTEGAGYRPLLARLLDTQWPDIPAGGTIDVPVAGRNGLPTRSVAGALLNLTVHTPSAGGHLAVWPTGESAPTTSVNNFNAGESRSAGVVVRPGPDGKVTIRNNSSARLRLIVDQQGWFADPLPGVPVAQHTPTSATQPAPYGSLELAYVDNDGHLLHGRIPSADSLHEIHWTPLSDGQTFTGPPALATQPDGRLQVATQYTDSNVWERTQSADSGTSGWADWAPLGGSMAYPPTAHRLSDGRLVQVAVDADGQLWSLQQSGPNGAYTNWHRVGPTGLVGAPAAITVEGGVRLVGLTSTGAVRTAILYSGSSVSSWTDLGGSGFTGTPALAIYPGYRVRVVVRSASGVLVTKVQDFNGNFDADWTPVGDLVTTGSPAALMHPFTGRTEIIARNADGVMYAVRETPQASGKWGAWTLMPGQDNFVAATDPTVLSYVNSTAPTYLVLVRDIDDVHHIWYPPSASSGRAGTAADGDRPTYEGIRLPAPPRLDG